MEELKKVFLKKAELLHGNRYNYSKVDYKNSKTKVIIICRIHGEFLQIPNSHLMGCNCPSCAIDDKKLKVDVIKESQEFRIDANIKHQNKYTYEKVNYVNKNTDVTITCPTHGDFLQKPVVHLKGISCNRCTRIKNGSISKKTRKEVFLNIQKNHGDTYTYPPFDFKNTSQKIEIICKKHGIFTQNLGRHMYGAGCKKCNSRGGSNKKSTQEFIDRATKVHNNIYDYSLSNYKSIDQPLDVICKKHGIFKVRPGNHINKKSTCPKCTNKISKAEQEINDFIKDFLETTQSNRTLLKNLELDIIIPSKNIAIEYNGLYYHSEKYKKQDSLINKTTLAKDKDYNLIHVFEDEWIYKKDIVKSRLKNILGLTDRKIYARNCTIKEVLPKTANTFLEENHIQGKLNSKIKLGLYYNEELVSLMTFGGLRKNLNQVNTEGSFELLRFCNKLNTSVIGGASKLLSHFEKYQKPKQLTSYADRRWSTGDLYIKLEFEFVHLSKPNYFYIKGQYRINRFNFRKDILVKEGFDKNKTEKEIMKERGFLRIYDCGALKFIKSYMD